MKYTELLSKMTLEEKAAFLSGKNVWQTRDYPHLGIPSILCFDGPPLPCLHQEELMNK